MARVGAREASLPKHGVPGSAGRKLVLIGFMGAGKSTAARVAAKTLGGEALDTDALLEAELGCSIAEYFEHHGEAAFRELEEAAVLRLLDQPGPSVLALGGGAVERERVRERLADHVPVYLEVAKELAWERARDSGRPLARDRERFQALHARRAPLYESVARAIVPVAAHGRIDLALDVACRLAAADVSSSVRMVWATTEAGGYPVYVGAGALGAAGLLLSRESRCFVVADEGAAAHHGELLAQALEPSATLIVPSGERHKTLAEAERLLRELAQVGMQGSDILLAFGGGVVGDLGGFCAAVYQRGVPLVQVPTTLVAQVDSAYGGKTGVDLPEAKNFVGAFHQPAGVLTDPQMLSTLPAEELRAGFAEVIKTALIAGGSLWQEVKRLERIEDAIEREPRSVQRLIEGCIRMKLAVVARDERDHGERASLNLGHTFAHALEAAVAYSGCRHGEAVGLGLLVALRLSERELGLDRGVREDVVDLLVRHGLPTTFSGPATEELLGRASLDKKRRGDRRNLVLLSAPGDVALACEVSDEAIAAAADEIRTGERAG